ncbi:MAG: hypothetical protein METHP_01178 [Methanoregula sp. SKADARSKE-2]|nr:MAG: hypothetical protein METHP_01178 [Methanoregula sp. SKADARSKE-2]
MGYRISGRKARCRCVHRMDCRWTSGSLPSLNRGVQYHPGPPWRPICHRRDQRRIRGIAGAGNPPGSIELRSIPGEASVVINNEYKGVAPLTVSGLDPGTYNVTLSRFGYRPISAPVKVEPGSVSHVNITLSTLTGALSVNSSLSGSEITVDGARTGISPMTFASLQQGNHTLNVTKDGYIPQILSVQVAADQTTRIDLTLAPLSRVGGEVRAPGMLPATLGAEIVVTLLLVIGRSRK